MRKQKNTSEWYVDPLEYDRIVYSMKNEQDLIAQTIRFLSSLKHPLDILDVGCGTGYLASKIQREFPQNKIIGIDQSAEFIAHIRRIYFDLTVVCTNIFSYDAQQKFDIIIASSVYHHIPHKDKQKFLAKLQSLLSENGIIIVLENFLPTYTIQNRSNAARLYYEMLSKYCNATTNKQLLNAIKNTQQRDLNEDDEYKVDYARFLKDSKASHLKIICKKVVWQNIDPGSNTYGSFFLVLNSRNKYEACK